jgi:hypothetical protein
MTLELWISYSLSLQVEEYDEQAPFQSPIFPKLVRLLVNDTASSKLDKPLLLHMKKNKCIPRTLLALLCTNVCSNAS